jgi:putative restriction endonuclease
VARKDLWSREEMLLTLCYYISLPAAQRRVPPKHILEELSNLTGRTVGSISLRFANFNSVDPEFTDRGLKGMQGGGGHVQTTWNEFSRNDGTLDSNLLLRSVTGILYAKANNLEG